MPKCILGPLDGKHYSTEPGRHWFRSAVVPPMSMEKYHAFLDKPYEEAVLNTELVTYKLWDSVVFGQRVQFWAPCEYSTKEEIERALVEKWFR